MFRILIIVCALLVSGICEARPIRRGRIATPPALPFIPLPEKPRESFPGFGFKKVQGNEEIVIVIDPGHGGVDFGTHSNSKPTYQEKNLNLATAKMLKTYLSQQGYTIILTRTDDTFISLEKRAEFANDKEPALFVSVHYNSAPSLDADGVEVFYYRSDLDKHRTKESKYLAKAILDKVLGTTKARSRGIKHGNFAVIRQTNMPAVLIEGGFLSNDEEMEKLKDPCYLKKIAWGITQGITAYLNKRPKAS
jgi:N-acetylmuramoyl-L-alanine amidase